jgi:hypothetical protein
MSDQEPIPGDGQEPVHNPELMEFADGLEQQLQQDNATELQQANAAQLAENQPVLEASAAMINKLLTGAVLVAEKRFTGINQIWTEQVISDTADAAAAVMVKYDMSAPEFVGKYKEEIHLVVTMGPPMFASWMMVKLMLEAEKKASLRAERENTPGLPPLAQSAQ